MADDEFAAFIRRNPDYQGEPIIDRAAAVAEPGPTDRMTEAEFAPFLARLRLVNTVVASVNGGDLERFIRTCSYADTIGPFIDPTAWMRGHDNVAAMVRAARALQDHQRELREAAGE